MGMASHCNNFWRHSNWVRYSPVSNSLTRCHSPATTSRIGNGRIRTSRNRHCCVGLSVPSLSAASRIEALVRLENQDRAPSGDQRRRRVPIIVSVQSNSVSRLDDLNTAIHAIRVPATALRRMLAFFALFDWNIPVHYFATHDAEPHRNV